MISVKLTKDHLFIWVPIEEVSRKKVLEFEIAIIEKTSLFLGTEDWRRDVWAGKKNIRYCMALMDTKQFTESNISRVKDICQELGLEYSTNDAS